MSKLKRILLHPLFPVALLIVGALSQLRYPSYGGNITVYVQSLARSHGWVLSIDRSEISLLPPAITLSTVNGFAPTGQFLLPFSFQQVSLHPRLLPYLWLHAAARGGLEGYGGTIDIDASIQLISQMLTVAISGKKLQLSSFPLLGALGISGTLHSVLQAELKRGKELNIYSILAGNIDATLEEGNFLGGLTEFAPMPLPQVSHINGRLIAERNKEELTVRDLNITSSLGNFSAKGIVVLSQSIDYHGNALEDTLNELIREVQLTGELELSDEGLKTVGGYLALASGNMQNQTSRQWSFSVNKKSRGEVNTVVQPSRIPSAATI